MFQNVPCSLLYRRPYYRRLCGPSIKPGRWNAQEHQKNYNNYEKNMQFKEKERICTVKITMKGHLYWSGNTSLFIFYLIMTYFAPCCWFYWRPNPWHLLVLTETANHLYHHLLLIVVLLVFLWTGFQPYMCVLTFSVCLKRWIKVLHIGFSLTSSSRYFAALGVRNVIKMLNCVT